MSNGVFNSGDLSTAASRRVPTVSNTTTNEDKNESTKASTTTTAAPLYARFRQSTSPYMNNDSLPSTSPAASPPPPATSPALSTQKSFLQLEDNKTETGMTGAENNGDATGGVPQSGRQRGGDIPSLTIKNGDDPFYRPNFECSAAKELDDPLAERNDKKANGTKENKITKTSAPSFKSARSSISQSGGAQHHNGHKTTSASLSVGTRILSAFRPSTYTKSDSPSSSGNVQVKSVPISGDGIAKTYPVMRQAAEGTGKTSVANIFSSIGSGGTFATAREGVEARDDAVSELGGNPKIEVVTTTTTTQTIEEKASLADSGLGKSVFVDGEEEKQDKPADPEEVLIRKEEPTRPVNEVKLIAGEPPTRSGKALDRLIGIPSETPAKAISTLTGIHVNSRPSSGHYNGRIPDARQSMFSIRSDTSTMATTYKEGKDDADESDVDTTTSTLGPLPPGALPSNGNGGRGHGPQYLPSSKSAWERERERKASAHSTSSDSSAAAVFSPSHPAPPVPAVPSRILANGPNALLQANNPLLRQAILTQGRRPTTADSLSSTWRPSSSGRDAAHDAMSSADEGPRPGTGISVATFETALSNSDQIPLDDMQDKEKPAMASEAGLRGGRLPSSVLVPRPKHSASKTTTSRSDKRLSKAISEAPSTRSQQSVQTTATTRDGPRKTLASLYLVAGLPKHPNNWALAENDSDIGTGEAAHMENAVPRWFKAEVLGSMVSGGGEAALDALEGFQGRNISSNRQKGYKKGKHAKSPSVPMTTIEEQPTLSKEETAKIQAKAIKLSMPRDVEIIAAGTAPPATSHTFSFTIKASSGSDRFQSGSIKGALGASWDMALAQSARPASTDRDDTTYYGASLIVWTHADKARTDAIRAAIEVGSKARSLAIARAAKAAAAGRKFGERLARQQATGGIVGAARGKSGGNVTSGGETEFETEVYMESEWEGRGAAPLNASATELPFLKSSTFWLPYALTLISKYPIYDLLSDTLRLSWARYHLNIARHSLTMRKLLEFPAPRPSERFKIPVDPLADAEGAFVMRFPGKVSLNSITADIDFQIWPTLRCLDADNLLRVAEIALSPFGRVIFFCQHVHMLNVAVETFRHLLEPRGWKGIVHGVVHTRDIKVFIEDPGPFLIGIDSRCINIAREKDDPEICYVDLETNDVRCQRPPPGALFKGAQRERLVKKLTEAIGNVGHYGVPNELTDAFPGSRFRPFSQVENGRVAPAERLLPPSNWNYNQDRFLSTFDAVMSIRPNSNVLQRILHFKNGVRKAAELSTNAQHVQQIVRNQSNNFVDKRDLMEAKLWRMNKRLALLMQESQSWNSQFTQFQGFTEKLSSEAIDLRTKLEKERREAKRLSGVVSESRSAQEELSKRLMKAEEAHREALEELEKIESFRRELQEQRDMMFNEMSNLASAADDLEMLEDIEHKIELKSETWSLARSASGHEGPRVIPRTSMTLLRAPSRASMRSARASSLGPASPGIERDNGHHQRSRKISVASNGTTRTLTEVREDGEEDEVNTKENGQEDLEDISQDMEDEEYLEAAAMRRIAITETMRSIQERLQTAMATAQARARSSALPSPPPPIGSTPKQRDQSAAARSATSSPSLTVPASTTPSRAYSSGHPGTTSTPDVKPPHRPRKSKSRTVVAHPGTVRKVEVPTSASDSE